MMGPFSRVVLAGCLNAMRWLLWLTGVLLAISGVLHFVRGEEIPQSLALSALGIFCVVGGFGCGWVARNFVPNLRV